jgi:integrase
VSAGWKLKRFCRACSRGRDTFACSLAEVKQIRNAIPEPARTIVLVAALSGLRKGEIAGLRWEDYTGKELKVRLIRLEQYNQ